LFNYVIKMFRRGNPFQKPYEGRKSLVVAAFLLASILMLSSVIVVLPETAAAQQATAPYSGNGSGSTPAPDDISKAMTKEGGEGDKDSKKKFEIVEASISDIHKAIKTGKATCTEIVQQYIDRAKAYNGVCTQLVTEDGASIAPSFGRVIVGSPQVFPTETVPVSSILPDGYESRHP
jgi:hypothetical protein